MIERLFPSEFGESSKVGDDIAVLGMEATIGGGTGTQSGIDMHGSSRAKMRARKKRLASEGSILRASEWCAFVVVWWSNCCRNFEGCSFEC